MFCEAKREGQREVGLDACADLITPRCRVFHPPECQTARLNPKSEWTYMLGSSCESYVHTEQTMCMLTENCTGLVRYILDAAT